MPNNKCRILKVTDDVVEETTEACSICYYKVPEHRDGCYASQKENQSQDQIDKKPEVPAVGTRKKYKGYLLDQKYKGLKENILQ